MKSQYREFWNTLVFYNGIQIPRDRALMQLQLAYSWELKMEGRNIMDQDQPIQEFMGKKVHNKIIEQLERFQTVPYLKKSSEM